MDLAGVLHVWSDMEAFGGEIRFKGVDETEVEDFNIENDDFHIENKNFRHNINILDTNLDGKKK